ncbi:MAG: phosphotransferase [Acidimicrobiales bacterium]
MVPDCPREVLDAVGGEPWIPLERPGAAGPDPDRPPGGPWWRVGERWVYQARPEPGPGSGPDGADSLLARMVWLGGRSGSGTGPGLDPGEVVASLTGWVVVDPPPGEPADRPERHPELVAVCPAVGRALAGLHRLDPTGAPPGATWTGDLSVVERAVAEDRFDVDRLVEPYRRYPPERLLAIAAAGPVGRSEPEPGPPTVGHGRASPATILLAGDRPSGLLALDRLGVTDRHRDLAAVQRRIHAIFGVDGVVAFAAGYVEAGGADIDLVRLDHGILIEVLLDAVVPVGATVA